MSISYGYSIMIIYINTFIVNKKKRNLSIFNVNTTIITNNQTKWIHYDWLQYF